MEPSSGSDTRTRIVDAARSLLVELGFEGLSMRKVAALVGVSAPALYRHFTGKDELLSAAVLSGKENFAAYLIRALGEKNAEARLVQMGHQYVAFARENWEQYQLLFNVDCQKLGYNRLDEKALQAGQKGFQLLIDRVTECQREGLIKEGDPVDYAVFIWSSLHGLVSLSLSGRMHPDKQALQQLLEKQLSLILAALRPGN